ncbi:MAG: hypothetical protein H6963_11625 [Chromatiaceae bacterium]|nr:hypothetical protein [Chromatiaceae bacterium]
MIYWPSPKALSLHRRRDRKSAALKRDDIQSEKMLSVVGCRRNKINPLAGMMQTAEVLHNAWVLKSARRAAEPKAAEAAGMTTMEVDPQRFHGSLRCSTDACG